MHMTGNIPVGESPINPCEASILRFSRYFLLSRMFFMAIFAGAPLWEASQEPAYPAAQKVIAGAAIEGR